VKKMVIDESRKYILTNYKNVKRGGEAVDSDHYTQDMDLDLKFVAEKPKREEIYNFKNKDAQEKFQKLSSETKNFSKCFSTEAPLMSQIENWRKTLEKCCKKSFRKIRIRKKNNKPLKENVSKLIDKRNILMNQFDDPKVKRKIEEISEEIAEEEAVENHKMIINNFKSLSENVENIPTAKRNTRGKIVSGPREIRNILAREYKDRLRSRPMRPDLKELKKRKKFIFDLKMKLSQAKSSPDWKMSDLEKALSNLKKNKSRDPEGYINEIFKTDVIGADL
jgi:hypothetical protein